MTKFESTKGECRWVCDVVLWVSMVGMKRAGRIVLNGLTGLSLILTALVAVMWVRSHWRCDAVWVNARTGLKGTGVIFYSNCLGISAAHWVNPDQHLNMGYYSVPPRPDSWAHSFLGVGWERGALSSPIASWTAIGIPYAYLLALFSLLPAIRLYRWRRCRKLNRPGHCAICGYDLRATPDRCPECGTPAPAPPSALGQSTVAGA
jgi:hypothetical protein